MDRADAIRLAMMGGVTIILVPILWSWWHLPSLTQTIVSSFVVLDRDVLSTRFRGVQRILGCLAGGAFGLLTIWLGIDSFFMWSIMLFAGVEVDTEKSGAKLTPQPQNWRSKSARGFSEAPRSRYIALHCRAKIRRVSFKTTRTF